VQVPAAQAAAWARVRPDSSWLSAQRAAGMAPRIPDPLSFLNATSKVKYLQIDMFDCFLTNLFFCGYVLT
jgi:hypothetical protein